MIQTGREEKQIAEQNKSYHKGVPATTVVVDGGWSKWSHKLFYNANSGVGVILVLSPKATVYRCHKQILCHFLHCTKTQFTTATTHVLQKLEWLLHCKES